MADIKQFYGLLCLTKTKQHATPIVSHPELHLNLWEAADNVCLDIGLKISKDYPAELIHFYFPWKPKDNEFDDLVPRLLDADSIAAIFNENWEITTKRGNSSAIVKDSDGKSVLEIVELMSHAKIEDLPDLHGHRFTLNFNELTTNGQYSTDMLYMRFRINNVPKSFYCVGLDQGDGGAQSSWARTEIIDFRLNVRRGAPASLEKTVGKFLSFSKIHLFLMRDRSDELAFEDATFKACRSLEDEKFWARYTLKSDVVDQKLFEKTLRNIKSSLGYQWTKKAEKDKKIDEFSVLAKFKHTVVSLYSFIFLACCIGFAGNAVYDFLKILISNIF